MHFSCDKCNKHVICLIHFTLIICTLCSHVLYLQGILYQEYSVARRDWEGERDKLIASKNQLTTAREQDQVRVRELANLQETLASGEDVQRRRIAEVSRKVTLLQVNEKTLSRRYTLLLDSEAALRKVYL